MNDKLYKKISEFEELLKSRFTIFNIIGFVPEDKLIAALSQIYGAFPQEVQAAKNALTEKLGEKSVYYLLHKTEQYIRSAKTVFGLKVVRIDKLNKYLDAIYAAMIENIKATVDIARGIEKPKDRIC